MDRRRSSQTRYESLHDDSRRLPRVVLRCPVRVATEGGEQVTATVHDISPDGLQLRCDGKAARAIHPARRAIRPGEEAPHVEVILRLPVTGGAETVRVLGQLIYFSLIASNVVAIGVRFVSISRADVARMDRFWMAALEPAAVPSKASPPRVQRQIKGAGDRMLVRGRKRAS